MTNFQANIVESVDTALSNLSQEEQQALLRYFATQECLKKEKEINKNYKDIGAYNPNRFAMQLEDRLRSKIWSSNKVTAVLNPVAEMQIESNVVTIDAGIVDEPVVKIAAKAGKKSKP